MPFPFEFLLAMQLVLGHRLVRHQQALEGEVVDHPFLALVGVEADLRKVA